MPHGLKTLVLVYSPQHFCLVYAKNSITLHVLLRNVFNFLFHVLSVTPTLESKLLCDLMLKRSPPLSTGTGTDC